MALLDELERGVRGIRVAMPEHLEVLADGESAELIDPELGVQWWLLFFDDLHMDLRREHREGLREGFEWPARTMFEDMYRHSGEAGEPRTADRSWSPLVEVEFLTIDDDPAVRVLHRMMYQPGREMIMGHLLVPVAGGLFEARALTSNGGSPTGGREAALTILAVESGADLEALEGTSRQAELDDPAHDEHFPEHPLSRLRAAFRGLVEPPRLEVIDAAPAHPVGRVKLGSPRCSLVPPPGFVKQGGDLTRVTFCGTDGVQALVVERLDDGLNVEERGREHARKLHEDSGVEAVELAVSETELDSDRRLVTIAVDGVGHQGTLRNTIAYFRAAQSLWAVAITDTRGVPPERVESELAAVARSLEAKKRPWRF